MTSDPRSGNSTTANQRLNRPGFSGLVVGQSRTAAEGAPDEAFLWDGTNGMQSLCTLTDCTAEGWEVLTWATDINNNGDIVGHGTIGGETHAFLIQAVPIPSAIWLFGSGLLGLVGIARRRKAA
jgi:hypothetical protein